MINLSNRLQVIADFVNEGETVADIGTDHGYIPIYLLANKKSPFVIVADISDGPLSIAKANLDIHNINNDGYNLRLCDGLKRIDPNEVDTIVIAGMGGQLITDILSEDIEKTKSFKKLIIQPRIASEILRQWLNENGFCIRDEKLVRESRFVCDVLVVEVGPKEDYSLAELEIGKRIIEKKDPLLKSFLLRKIGIENKILESTYLKETERSLEQRESSSKRIAMLEEVLSQCQ